MMKLFDGSWHRAYGTWWMVTFAWAGWLSLGLHIDFCHHRRTPGKAYGPYIDLHLGVVVVSLGYRPIYAGEVELRSPFALMREQA